MNEKAERKLRRRAVRLLAAGQRPNDVLQQVGRSRSWLSKWRKRCAQQGAAGLHSHSRGPRHHPQAWPRAVRQMIVQARRRLGRAPAGLIGAQAIQGELRKLLPRRRLPSKRTIGRVLVQEKVIVPAVAERPSYFPAPSQELCGSLDALDWTCRYLAGGHKVYAFHTLNLRTRAMGQTLADNKSLTTVRQHVLEAWQTLGIPQFLQTDNDAVFCGGYKVQRVFGSFARLCLWLGIELIFLPYEEPQHNSAVEQLNGLWGGPAFWQRHHFRCPGDVRRLSPAFLAWYWDTYTPPALGGLTPRQAQRHETRPRLTPALLRAIPEPLPLTAGRVHFIRRVPADGSLRILNEPFQVSPGLLDQYVWATLTTHRRTLDFWHRRTARSAWRWIKHLPYDIPEPIHRLQSRVSRLFTMS